MLMTNPNLRRNFDYISPDPMKQLMYLIADTTNVIPELPTTFKVLPNVTIV